MRQPEPYFRKQTKTYYVQIGKKQHNLGPDKQAAVEKYRELMACRQGEQESIAVDKLTVSQVLFRFLEWVKANKADGSYKFYSRPVKSFAAHAGGRLKAYQLRPFHVDAWQAACYPASKHSSTYRRNAIRAVQRAFNWAAKQGLVASSPIAKMEKPAGRSRDAILTPEQWQELATALASRGPRGLKFLDLLTLMRQTGCRPLEARTAEARHLDRQAHCLVFEKSESKGAGRTTENDRRVIPLTDLAFELCERLAKATPAGPFMRNSKGRPWTCASIRKWFKRLNKSGRVSFRTSAYVIRHTWATEALERGVDPITVATIMGHKDVTMLMKVYQHLNKKSGHLRAALNKAVGLSPATSPAVALA